MHTGWLKPDVEYEERCLKFLADLLAPGSRFHDSFRPFQEKVAFYGCFNSLSQLVIKFTAPGTPDLYQGSELWDFRLVDPDNRRTVDFEQREKYLREIKAREADPASLQELFAARADGRFKLFLTYKLLAIRRKYPDIFRSGTYLPVRVVGEFRRHVLAFSREKGETKILVVVPRFLTGLITPPELPVGMKWKDTRLLLEHQGREWKDLLFARTGELIPMELSRIFSDFPVAVWIHSVGPQQ